MLPYSQRRWTVASCYLSRECLWCKLHLVTTKVLTQINMLATRRDEYFRLTWAIKFSSLLLLVVSFIMFAFGLLHEYARFCPVDPSFRPRPHQMIMKHVDSSEVRLHYRNLLTSITLKIEIHYISLAGSSLWIEKPSLCLPRTSSSVANTAKSRTPHIIQLNILSLAHTIFAIYLP